MGQLEKKIDKEKLKNKEFIKKKKIKKLAIEIKYGIQF